MNIEKNLEILENLRRNDLQYIASWALYDVDESTVKSYVDANPKDRSEIIPLQDIAFPARYQNNNKLAEAINPKVMFVALNAADRDVLKGSWANFHDTRAKDPNAKGRGNTASRDRNILMDLYHTDFYGGYMTDLYKDFPETNSGEIDTVRLANCLDYTSDELHDIAVQATGNKTMAKLYHDIVSAKTSLKMLQYELDTLQPKVIVCYHSKVKPAIVRLVRRGWLKLPENCALITQTHYAQSYPLDKRLTDLVTESDHIMED